MRFIFLFSFILVTLTAVRGSFINPYPRFKSYNDGGNPGDALYLTEYIEKGDIETVNLLWFSIECYIFSYIPMTCNFTPNLKKIITSLLSTWSTGT